MSGVSTAVFVLTLICRGVICGPIDGQEYRVDTYSPHVCELLRAAAVSQSMPHAVLEASCIGEVRQVSLDRAPFHAGPGLTR